MSTPFDYLLTSMRALEGLESSNRLKNCHEIFTLSIWPKLGPTARKIFSDFQAVGDNLLKIIKIDGITMYFPFDRGRPQTDSLTKFGVLNLRDYRELDLHIRRL